MSNSPKLRRRAIRAERTGAPAGSLPYQDSEDLAGQLVEAARLDDGGARLGELCGLATLDWHLAGTVLADLAVAVAVLTDTAAAGGR